MDNVGYQSKSSQAEEKEEEQKEEEEAGCPIIVSTHKVE